LTKYGLTNTMPKVIDEPDDLPTEVEEWLEYFPQAKPCFSGGDLDTSALLGCSIPLPKILKALGNWFPKAAMDFGRQPFNWRKWCHLDGYSFPPTISTPT